MRNYKLNLKINNKMEKLKLKNKQSRGSIQGPDGTIIECVWITPEIANQILDLNTNNRKVKEATKDKYARDMASGKWEFNGDAIRILENLELADGQHRLFSCIKSGESFWSLIIWNLSEKVRMTIDVGPSKSTADHFTMLGIKNSTIVASTARRVLSEELNGNPGRKAFSNSEIYEEVTGQRKGIYQKAANFAVRMYKEYPNLKKPTYAFSYVELITKGYKFEKIEDFFKQLTDQKEACETVRNLRKRILPPTDGTKIPVKMKEYYLKKAWNEWAKGNHKAKILNCREYRDEVYVKFE